MTRQTSHSQTQLELRLPRFDFFFVSDRISQTWLPCHLPSAREEMRRELSSQAVMMRITQLPKSGGIFIWEVAQCVQCLVFSTLIGEAGCYIRPGIRTGKGNLINGMINGVFHVT